MVLIWTGEVMSASATSTSRADWRSRIRSLASGSEVITRPRPLASTCWNGHGAVPALGSQSGTVLGCR